MSELGRLLGRQLRDKDVMKTGMGGGIGNYLLFIDVPITFKLSEIKVEDRDYIPANQVIILGHSTYGILGTYKLGLDSTAFTSWSTVETLTPDQVLTNVGRTLIRDWFAGDSVTGLTHIAFGTGTNSFDVEDTALQTEVIRVTSSNSLVSKDLSCVAFLTTVQGSGSNFREIGLFNASSSGTLIERGLISSFSKTSSNELRITPKITVTNSVPMMDSGVTEVLSWLDDGSGDPPTYMAWGNGTTDISTTDTTMENELERNALSGNRKGTFNVRIQGVLTRSEQNGLTIDRTALFNDPTSGDMIVYAENWDIEKKTSFQVQTEHIIRII